jgi:hypothetical protein
LSWIVLDYIITSLRKCPYLILYFFKFFS